MYQNPEELVGIYLEECEASLRACKHVAETSNIVTIYQSPQECINAYLNPYGLTHMYQNSQEPTSRYQNL